MNFLLTDLFSFIDSGVDDMYILLYAMKKQRGYTQQDFLKAMKEVIVPVTMTSVVNLSMFAVLNMSVSVMDKQDTLCFYPTHKMSFWKLGYTRGLRYISSGFILSHSSIFCDYVLLSSLVLL
jgi:hypothetical protein